MAPSSLIVKGPRTRGAPKKYSPSPKTTTFPSNKRTPKQKKELSTKGRPPSKKKTTKTPLKLTPKKITKASKKPKQQKEKAVPAIPAIPPSPKTRKQKAVAQHTLSLGGGLYVNVPRFNNKLTQAQISEIESLVSPWYTAEDMIKRLRTMRKPFGESAIDSFC